jgi:hypothetical protein
VGREFVFVAIRPAWGEDRVFLFDEDGVQRSLPARWTDAVAPDAFVALSGGRSAFRVADLLALGALCDGLRGSVGGEDCKADSAATVRAIMPGLALRSGPRSGYSRHET